jgi:predicted porin
MQKKIIALAVAGLSTAAFAQTNVTIYGVADVSGEGYALSKGKALAGSNANPAQGNVFALQSNSSLLGFKGTEDLGNGLKALFQFENGMNLKGGAGADTTNAATGWGGLRDSFVGLNSKYGTALAGYLSTPYRSALTSFDVLPGATGNGRAEQMMGTMRFAQQSYGSVGTGAFELASSIRASAIAYAMPTLYGFDGSIAYTGSNNNGTTNASSSNIGTAASTQSAPVQSAMSFNLGWTGYGVNIKGAFQQASVQYTQTDTMANAGDFTSYLVGASYTGIQNLKASVVYNRNSFQVKNGGITGVTNNGADKLSNNQIYAGVSYRMGNWEPRVAYTMTSDNNGAVDGQMGARQWVLNTGYYLSKRTQVYGLVSNLNNSANQNYFAGLQSNNLKPTGGQNLFTYGMGLRTTF